MISIVKRISKMAALLIVYVIFACGYMSAKGFVISDGVPVLAKTAQAAEDEPFARRVFGDVGPESMVNRAIGPLNAPLTMYVYSSMTCSHCREFHNYILPKLEKDFVAQGKIKIVFIHMPLEPTAMKAAKLSYCLPPSKYYDFIDELYRTKDWLFANDDSALIKHAQKFGLSDSDITACKNDKKLTSDILMAKKNAEENYEVRGTPTVVVDYNNKKELLRSAGYGDLKNYLNEKLGE
jgi:protein-disulfide isomerase